MTTNTSERRWHRGFWSLIVTQFQGAFSDNALKTVVTFFGLSLALPAFWHRSLVPIATGVLSLPFILFSMAGGFFADRYSKRTVTIGVKVFEIAIMSFATGAFLTRNLWMGMTAIFLMGTHSAIFGPSKYGSLPELLPEKQLSWGNGILELGTFLAIILGAAAGGYLFDWFRWQLARVGFILIALAVLGLITSLGITRVPAAVPTQKFKGNFLGDLFSQIRLMRQDRVLWLACLGNIYFSFVGQLVFQGVFDLGDRMHLTERSTSLLVVACTRHRRGQLCGRLFFRRKNRVWPRPARRAWFDGLQFRSRAAQPNVPLPLAAAWRARVLRRLLHRADLRATAAPSQQGTTGGRACRQ